MPRFFRACLKALGTILVELALWFVDKRWGDAMFAWIKQQVPDDLEAWLLPVAEFSWDWGLPLAVALAGLWLMFRKDSARHANPAEEKGYIDMKSAAQRLYAATAGQPKLREHLEDAARNNFEGSILAACADRIWNKSIAIRGERAGTSVRESLPVGASLASGFGSLRFSADATTLISDGRPEWVNLAANEMDLVAYLGSIRGAGSAETPPEFMSMHSAAMRAYETFRATGAWDMVPQEPWSVGEPLSWCATYLALKGIPVYGVPRYTQTRERIRDEELQSRLNFENEATELHAPLSKDNPRYTQLEVRSSDLDLQLQAIKATHSKNAQMVPLQDAVRELFDGARHNAVVGMAVARKTEEEKLEWLASVLWGKVPLQVRFQISNQFEALPKDKQRERYVRFRSGRALLLYDHMGEEQVAACEIAVLRSDLDNAIRRFNE